jgi:hypothetical protein
MTTAGMVRSRFIKVFPQIEPGILHEHRGLWMGLEPGKDGGMLEG